jgi:hypothetical protein
MIAAAATAAPPAMLLLASRSTIAAASKRCQLLRQSAYQILQEANAIHGTQVWAYCFSVVCFKQRGVLCAYFTGGHKHT